jgi:hypothetical protein
MIRRRVDVEPGKTNQSAAEGFVSRITSAEGDSREGSQAMKCAKRVEVEKEKQTVDVVVTMLDHRSSLPCPEDSFSSQVAVL